MLSKTRAFSTSGPDNPDVIVIQASSERILALRRFGHCREDEAIDETAGSLGCPEDGHVAN
jgi:hypothetical protein